MKLEIMSPLQSQDELPAVLYRLNSATPAPRWRQMVTGDSCASLAAAYDLTNDDIEMYNKDTWGWNGCAKIYAGYYICLSTGYPPMPATVPNAVCGPQVNDTAKAPPGTDLSTLNQCPLNACCNIWGQCGTTSDFCTPSNSSTGAPGTAAPNQNGCISNCGTEVLISSAPSELYSIAYFEAFDWQRPCLRMSVASIDTSAYTHIHFSFITLNADFSINTDDVADQLPLLRGMSGVKKIVSLGGWTFSTDPSTYTILRNAVSSEANRQTLVTNVVNFLNDYNLDGIDWDWEYPDEPDIPGIPAGTEADSTGYFLLLDELKTENAIWQNMVDYIVYLTYDLHGQWDYSNQYADPGCPSAAQGLGNCLRSHVNLTETINALSMITKAGVPSNIIAVGVSSYGRSFQMTTPGCWTEQCTYTGPDSGAFPGECTETAGYLANYEIDLILSQNPSAQTQFDNGSFSNIVVFNNTQWVAYMDDDNKAARKAIYSGMNFLGSVDWAVDLQSEGGSGSGSGSVGHTNCHCLAGRHVGLAADAADNPNDYHIPALDYNCIVCEPYNKYKYPKRWINLSVSVVYLCIVAHCPYNPPWDYLLVTTTAIPVWGVSLDPNKTVGDITLTSSIQPPPFTVTVTPVISGTTSIIGATTTTTSPGGIIIWGSITYSDSEQTETLGGVTSIVGGHTLPPAVITVTPNPHPTTVPSTRDPKVNPKTPSWTSGKTPEPTSNPGCLGCGSPCILFCNPSCPFCPPGVFPGGIGGGGSGSNPGSDPDDPSSETSTSESPATTSGTFYFDIAVGDSFETGFAALADLSSISNDFISAYHWISTSTTTQTPTTTAAPPPPPPPPSPTPDADCDIWDEGWGLNIEVYNIMNWATDGGKALLSAERGCGALTGWEFYPETSEKYAYSYFNLPFFIGDGCVEREIVAAGGPKLSCTTHGLSLKEKKKRESAMSRWAWPNIRTTPQQQADHLPMPQLHRQLHGPATREIYLLPSVPKVVIPAHIVIPYIRIRAVRK
ncbi:hypothetical protein ONZ43_g2378 [Nemania bipapillata]|uniref:Uncharacterized protein n=1 Tax=Nemania bipapillata TaxID=110536 RepID=A0ACC2J0X1_9PEZI|nr:hypothetical protein ONZ43_g2378 [Nemania bipapillata]